MAEERFFIIDDTTHEEHLIVPGKGRGLDLSSRPRGAAYTGVADPFPNSLLIPRSDWQGMIQEQEERGTRIIDVADLSGVKVKNQQQTNFCWMNAPTHTLELVRAMANQPYVELSPASGAAQITGYKNVGGWGLTALQWISTNGIVPAALWPVNYWQSAKYATPQALAIAKRYVVDEWWELDAGNLDQVVSCILRGIPVALGYNWWGHEVSGTFLKWIDGAIALGIDNSWGTDWGTNGRGVLQGQRMIPDDAVAPRTALAA